MRNKWQKTGLEVVFDAASPYTGTEANFRTAARRLAGVDLIVLDCIGFTGEMKRIFREESGKPVILPLTLLGRVCGELLDIGVGR
jgi:protein AroM